MSIRFDAVADQIVRSTDLPNWNAGYTVMAWVYSSASQTTFVYLMWLANSDETLYEGIASDTGTAIGPRDDAGGNSVFSISNGVWYHVALVRTSVTNLTSYIAAAGGATTVTNYTTANVTSRAACAHLEMAGAANFSGNEWNGRIAAAKLWTAALTQAQVEQERYCIRPRNLDSIYGWWPMWNGSGERTRDYSGLGRDWTPEGTLTDEDPPPVAY